MAMIIDTIGSNSPISQEQVQSYEPRDKENKPLLNCVAIFDVAQEDTNGIFLQRARDVLANEIPLFCSRRLLTGQSLNPILRAQPSSESMIAQREIASMLGQNNAKCDILLDKISRTQVCILPRTYYGSLDLKEKLAKLEMASNAVAPSSWEELIKNDGNESVTQHHPLKPFFSMLPKSTNLRLHIGGHGGSESESESNKMIAGLSKAHFGDIVNGLNQSRCQVLCVSSCEAGGENRKHYPKSKFPVIVFSIGNFPTSYSKENYKLFFSKFDSIFQQETLTHEMFEKQFATNSGIENWRNFTQVRLPNSQKFRLIQEDRSICILKQKPCRQTNAEFKLADTRMVALYARLINPSITLENEIPFFLSMRQEATPVHIFSSLRTPCSLDQLFETTRIKVKSAETMEFDQILFFHTLICKDGEYRGVYMRHCIDCISYSELLAFRIADKTHIQFQFDCISEAIGQPKPIPAETYNQRVSRHINKEIIESSWQG